MMSSARARRSTRAGTILDPDVWWDALLLAVERAGGLEDVAAVSVSGQQHTPVFLDASGLRWLRDTDPDAAERTAAVAVVHDWLTWRLMGFGPGNADFDMFITDRSEPSGTGYWSGDTEEYCLDLFELALGRRAILPRVLKPTSSTSARLSPAPTAGPLTAAIVTRDERRTRSNPA